MGYERVGVRPYIPLPLKCKYCLRFGHHFNSCDNNKLCSITSNNIHINLEKNETCTEPASCINCIETHQENTYHSPNNKNCPIFLNEKEIQAIITLEKVNKKTAVEKYNEINPSTSTNYATITKYSTETKSTYEQNNNKPTMPPPATSPSTRVLKDYTDIIKVTDISDEDTARLTSYPAIQQRDKEIK